MLPQLAARVKLIACVVAECRHQATTTITGENGMEGSNGTTVPAAADHRTFEDIRARQQRRQRRLRHGAGDAPAATAHQAFTETVGLG